MKEIKTFAFDNSVVSGSQNFVNYTVTGDPGSVFSVVITNEDSNYYNFPENTTVSIEENISTPVGAFSSTPSKLSFQEIDKTGVYYGSIDLPSVTDNDLYSTIVYAESSFDTVFDKKLSSGLVYLPEQINQLVDTSLTFSLSSTGSDGTYNSYPSDVVASGVSTSVSKIFRNRSFSISWPVTLSSSQFVIAKQPTFGDFYISTTKDTLSAGSGTSLELKSIIGLSVGMVASGTGIASGATIVDIIPGYKDNNKSTSSDHVYVIPSSVSENIVTDSSGGTVILSDSSTFVADRTITFKGYGQDAIRSFTGAFVEIKNPKLVIDAVTTTTDAAVSNSTTIPLTSTNGIKAADTVIMSGIGIVGTPHVDAVSAGVNITASSAQTIENGQTVTFTGSSRSATITADVVIKTYGDQNLTITLELDNILTVG
jgi:hypothetical protein